MGWLETYLDYTEQQESPEEFHLWCGISAIAASLNRHVWISRTSRDGVERFRDYPGQLSIVLVAGSGKARKSTAVDISQSFMKAANVRLFDGKITPERLLNKMGQFKDGKAVLTVVASELSTFMSKASYNDGLIDILTKLADCRDDAYETQRGNVLLSNVCLTILAATTPSSLGKSIPTQAHETGFLSRWIFVYGDRSNKIEPLSTTDAEVDPLMIKRRMEMHSYLQTELTRFGRIDGPFVWTPPAKDWYDEWYIRYSQSEAAAEEGWPSRRPSHLLRLAQVLEMSSSSKKELTAGSVIAADMFLAKYVEAFHHRSFAYIGRNMSADQQEKICDIFRKNVSGQPITASEIYFRTIKHFKDGNELRQAIDTLRMAGVLECTMLSSGDEHWKMIKEPY